MPKLTGRLTALAVAAMLVAAAARSAEYVEVIGGFEDDVDIMAWILKPGQGKEVSTERASEGKRSLKIAFEAGKGVILGSLYSTSMPFDWSGFDAFRMDVWNATGAAGQLKVKIKSGDTENDPAAKRFYKSFDLPVGAWTTCEITVKEMAANWNPEGLIYMELTAPGAGNLFVDNVRLAAAARPAPVSKYVRLTWTDDPRTAMTVAWQSREESGELRYSPAAGGAAKTVKAATKRLFASGVGMLHEAAATGLKPGAEYSYQVRSGGGEWTAPRTFATAPDSDDAKVVFLVGSDVHEGRDVLKKLLSRLGGDAAGAGARPAFALYCGDATHIGGIRSHWERWFAAIESFASQRPVMRSTGNHEINGDPKLAGYVAINTLPASPGGELYYSFDYGPVHFMSLETELGDFDAELKWLAEDLAATKKPWKVAFCHSPPFSSGAIHGSDMQVREKLAPLFDRHHVDAVFGGDDHIYERSKPMNVTRSPGAPVASYREGTCYVVASPAGGPLYQATQGNWWTEKLRTGANFMMRVIVEGKKSMRLEAVDIDGKTFDDVTLEK